MAFPVLKGEYGEGQSDEQHNGGREAGGRNRADDPHADEGE